MTLREIISKILEDKFASIYGIPCKVSAVDTVADPPTCDCDPVNGDPSILDVRLQSGAGNGVTIIPSVGSVVMVQMISDVAGYVTMFSQVDSIQLADGSDGGLVKVSELVDRLNLIEQDINELKDVFANWIVVANDGGGALKTASASWRGTQLTETEVSDIENPDVKHGNV